MGAHQTFGRNTNSNPSRHNSVRHEIPTTTLHKMALIACYECNNQVSDTAASCPKCGAPVSRAAKVQRAIGTPVETIQATSKKLKAHIVFSAIISWIGIIWLIIGISINRELSDAEDASLTIPILLTLIGFSWYIVTRIRIWWHHK